MIADKLSFKVKLALAVAMFAFGALLYISVARLVTIASVTKVDSIEIAGTTDATGVVTARAGMRLTTPTTGPLFTSGSGIPAGTATIGSLYLRTDTAQLYQNTDGATAWSRLGSAFSGASAHNNGTSTSVATSTDTPMPLTVESYDTANYHSTTVNTSRFTVPVSGYYMLSGSIEYVAAGGGSGLRQALWRKNGTTPIVIGRDFTGFAAIVTSVGTALLTAGDYVELLAFQDTGGPVDATTRSYEPASVTLLGSL